jgi:hypothetical protein
MEQQIVLIIVQVLQVVLALVLLNVWLMRFNKSTKYRGGESHNMVEEFKAYGLSTNFMYFVGFMKVLIALSLLVGLFYGVLVLPAVAVLVVLMVGAIAMHLKIKDSFLKTMPATIMLVLSLIVFFLIA